MERYVGTTKVSVQRGDITLADADAIVYDITSDCKLGSGLGGAIAARGGKVIQDELNAIGSCPTGSAVVTSGGNLKARYIIHVNGPKFHEPDTEEKLAQAIRAALRLADAQGAERLALPPIGTGLYQVPLDLSARVMLETIAAHLANGTHLREIVIVVKDPHEVPPFAAQLERSSQHVRA